MGEGGFIRYRICLEQPHTSTQMTDNRTITQTSELSVQNITDTQHKSIHGFQNTEILRVRAKPCASPRKTPEDRIQVLFHHRVGRAVQPIFVTILCAVRWI